MMMVGPGVYLYGWTGEGTVYGSRRARTLFFSVSWSGRIGIYGNPTHHLNPTPRPPGSPAAWQLAKESQFTIEGGASR